MVTQTNTNYDLLVLCVTCEQRPLVYHEKQQTSCIPTKNVYVSLRQIRHLRKTDFRKLKITLVTMTYHRQRPQCPSLSPHVLLLQVEVKLQVFIHLLYFGLSGLDSTFLFIVTGEYYESGLHRHGSEKGETGDVCLCLHPYMLLFPISK